MSHSSFAFTPSALRSLRVDRAELERRSQRRWLEGAPRLSAYLLHKEARDTGPTSAVQRRIAGAPPLCRDLVVHNALFTGNLEAVQRLFPRGSPVDLLVESQGGDMRWVCQSEGLWSLTYEQELTTPLHIAASRGYADCLRHLLQRGANVELAPGGTTALHEACEGGHSECARLLLSYGANANATNEEGLAPLHMCIFPESLECAKHLLQFGAAVNGRSLEEDDTPLHVAARHGLPDHADLYLRYGAALDRQNDEGQTPLITACAEPQAAEDLQRYHQVCRLLVSAGANVRAEDRDSQTPLHMASKNVNADVAELLLQQGANVNNMCYSGDTPMHNVLKAVAYKAATHHPERIVRALLNYGSTRVWPGALPKLLKHCCKSPRTMEVILNAYDRLKITDTWREAVPHEVFQEHRGFYESVFVLTQMPRSLQHLARCKVRGLLEGRVPHVVPKLGLPTFLQKYLLLEFRDYIH
ncbi:ankyrin repeat and SOCS box protein 10 isoform X1 [Brienomyrus brachyistius]|uniref:ankyrin repeat and SOCS box protein 10 isoform X1 n=1 Tax=Brienomyrus brachyistius TaxID=42636 RepID=UPI0020B1BF9C|nr:ankyrin repeat and SOCS box protein 10 isoform X1 [Brienomyrus brachyistius]